MHIIFCEIRMAFLTTCMDSGNFSGAFQIKSGNGNPALIKEQPLATSELFFLGSSFRVNLCQCQDCAKSKCDYSDFPQISAYLAESLS